MIRAFPWAPAALTGDSYLGHVFWDTEIYLLPFYIATWPEAARTLLIYRFRTLDGARAKAARWRLAGRAVCLGVGGYR